MITADQLLLHLIGDYVTQSDWMAQEKSKRWWPAAAHAVIYSAPFWLLKPSIPAWIVICGTHVLIDRYRLARYLVWFKNRLFAPPHDMEITVSGWPAITATGYSADRPAWLVVWLFIIADNTLHILCNGLALYYL